jgi:hypothetical protein
VAAIAIRAVNCIDSPTPESTRHRVMSQSPNESVVSPVAAEKITVPANTVHLRLTRSMRYPDGRPSTPMPSAKMVDCSPASVVLNP